MEFVEKHDAQRESRRPRSAPVTTITEAVVEEAALDWLAGLGWQVGYGSDIVLNTPAAEWHNCRAAAPEQTHKRVARPALHATQGRFAGAIHGGDSRIAPTTTV